MQTSQSGLEPTLISPSCGSQNTLGSGAPKESRHSLGLIPRDRTGPPPAGGSLGIDPVCTSAMETGSQVSKSEIPLVYRPETNRQNLPATHVAAPWERRYRVMRPRLPPPARH